MSGVPLPDRGSTCWKERPADIARRAPANPGETSTDGPFRRRRFDDWGKHATTDASIINSWFDRWPNSNIGVVLGPESGIIDLKDDGPEGVKLYSEWFGGSIPRTPAYSSGKGVHHLFRYQADLPQQAHLPLGPNIGDIKIGFGGATQSVFPPSWHYSGKPYQWLVSPTECDVATLPGEVVAKIKERIEQRNGAAKRVVFNDTPLDTSPDVDSVLRKLRKSSNAAAFSALFDNGDTGGDASSADFKLVARIAFFAGRDAALIDQIFRQSAIPAIGTDAR